MGRSQSLKQSLPSLRRIVERFWPYIRVERRLIAGSLLALFLGVGLRLLEPWPLKFVIDRVLGVKPTHTFNGLQFVEALDSQVLLFLASILLVLITGLRALADYYNTIGFSQIGNRVLTRVRNDLYRHLQCLSMSFHTRARSGDLIVRVIGDVNMLRDITVTAALPLAANVLILAGMVFFMFWLQWRLAIVALATLPVFWLVTLRISRRIQESAGRQRQREGAMASTAAETIGAIKVVQALSLEKRFGQAFFSRSQQSQNEDVKGSRLMAGMGRTVDVLAAFSTAITLFYGGWLVLQQAMSPGDLLVFLAYLKRALNPLQDFAKYTGRMSKAAAAGERVLDLLDRTPEVRDFPGAIWAPAFRGEVRFEDVSFAYEGGAQVLEGINFVVQPGQYVSLVGPSGIGKSTLVSLILRLYDPVHGHVKIDRRDIRSYTLESLRTQMSVVLQDSILFAASVWDNIVYGAPSATRDQIEAAARMANAHQFIEALSQGYETELGERGVTLSHGQRQRIAIARAAIRQAPILILDEPTVGLDEENESAVIEALERLAFDRTTFVITHDLKLAARADLILYLENGHLLESGTHYDLMQAGGRYATLFTMQSGTNGKNSTAAAHNSRIETQSVDGNLMYHLNKEIAETRQLVFRINSGLRSLHLDSEKKAVSLES
ncbi:MAG: protein tyrosine phosphatase [Chloroflexi bacterium RBG_16_54_18]|nr:MAG: protein tyrosine phosphatase [Chloroflexi bacterium RBG_16_54_18]